jgi:hypothetical protein
MAVFNYRRFKILLNADSKKTQGLRTGDIVRRQYFDGSNIIYSLMCVLDYGTDAETQQPYFVGALLEGQEPETSQLLDFARITSLIDTDRSGALYLTASDSKAPYMDVIDGIGRNSSFCWPVNIADGETADPMAQYVVVGSSLVTAQYLAFQNDNNRILHITRNATAESDAIGIEQSFYKNVAPGDRILVSYKIKASTSLTADVTLQYEDETHVDGTLEVDVSTDWEYKFHAIGVEYSGRHLRKFSITFYSLAENDEVWISDLNIIPQASLTNYNEASQMRVGRLDGVSDAVFGALEGYGGYMQKLYATGSAHISGTLTAGDENGFAATFYAGKIHRNAFVNSLSVNFSTSIALDQTQGSPTGVGNVYAIDMSKTVVAQSHDWLVSQVGRWYCFSFWVYAMQKCQITVYQNNHLVGTINIPYAQTHAWHRHHLCFELYAPNDTVEGCLITLTPTFNEGDTTLFTGEVAEVTDMNKFLFASPQLESGKNVTQYQPTDATLNYTEDYGAWFSRGGIGGTIQNPILKLNSDGNGSIGARSNAFLLRQDGSGYLANNNIMWDSQGNVRFGDRVVITWDNLSENVQDKLWNCSIRILGGDSFLLQGDLSGTHSFAPATITLTINETNMESTSTQRAWYYLSGVEWVQIQGANGLSLVVSPDDAMWGESSSLTIKAEVTIGDSVFADTHTIRKEYITGYSVQISSSKGQTFFNGVCQTVLTANVYYQGMLVDDDFVAENFVFCWKKYTLPDVENEVEGWWEAIYDDDNNLVQAFIDRTQKQITLNCEIQGSDMYVCELQTGEGFELTFPAII